MNKYAIYIGTQEGNPRVGKIRNQKLLPSKKWISAPFRKNILLLGLFSLPSTPNDISHRSF